MLKLENIVKEYAVGDEVVRALKGVSIEFRENEFVSILGPSGCGKTTLLNIIGGLDQYTSGDLIINDISTKKYKDRDWDSYRNHKIGFVFQSYNLIPHQTVLANVELALTLSGVSRKERKRRAKEALIKVGLGDQIKKKPNQMSGGQMQRVAIARALVNNPDILLADEPTGALDTETSSQVMDILAEVAADRLVIMVTHNPELAQIYSTRIIRLLDGRVMSDTMPISDDDSKENTDNVNKFVNLAAPKTWNDRASLEAYKVPDNERTTDVASSDTTDNTVTSNSNGNAYELYGSDTYVSSKTKEQIEEELKSAKKSQKNAKKVEKAEKKAERKAAKNKTKRPPRTSMKLHTALSLSLNNLMTKKGRTFLTAFAGSIGIIGIALILSLSNGVQLYIDGVEEDTLSSYPLTIEKTTIDMTSFMTSMASTQGESQDHDDDHIYTNQIMTSFMDIMLKEVATNNLKDFKKYIEANSDRFGELTQDIHYGYSTTMNVYKANMDNGIYQVNPGQVFKSFGLGGASSGMMMTNTEVWQRFIDNDELLKEQYDVVYGKIPEKYNEVALIVSKDNEVTDYTLYSLGILDSSELSDTFMKMAMGEDVEFPEPKSYSFEEICDYKFKLLLNSDYFEKSGDIWVNKSDDDVYLMNKLNNAEEISIVGILSSSSNAASSGLAGTIGYRTELMTHLIDEVNSSEIVKAQKANPDVDIFTGIKFEPEEEVEVTMDMVRDYIASLPTEEQAQMNDSIKQMRDYGMSDERILETFSTMFKPETTDNTYESNLRRMGVSDREDPSNINIYPKDFESKDALAELIAEYNKGKDEDEKITYTDYVGLIMSSVTTIINAISYILIAFVAISLVVSSIMIGIITYISVLERTKEIGILRAIGASKKDVSRVFNAETLIIGFSAGALGILITELLLIPINRIILYFTDIDNIAQLPPLAGVILVVISMVLTFIAGLFPSRIAAKKDPVVALRSE